MPIEALTYKFCMLHRLERFGGIDEKKVLEKYPPWLCFFGGGRLWFMLFHSKLLITNDMYWVVL